MPQRSAVPFRERSRVRAGNYSVDAVDAVDAVCSHTALSTALHTRSEVSLWLTGTGMGKMCLVRPPASGASSMVRVWLGLGIASTI